jgi:hypothetical protein
MRHLRPYLAVFAIATIAAACSSGPGSSSGGDGSQAAGESQPAASTGGGGGGGGGANGSMTYEITGDYEASGELPFVPAISIWDPTPEGWVAYFGTNDTGSEIIQINTQSAEGTSGQIWNFGDGVALIVATSDPGSGSGCTFTLTKNDATGTAGSVECSSAIYSDINSGATGHVQVSAEWDAHP